MTFDRRKFINSGLGTMAVLSTPIVFAQNKKITLRLHHFWSPQAPIPKDVISPWINKIQKESEGNLRIQHFSAMQLGGKAGDLFDQAKNGVVDIICTVLGYTPGRFPKSEVFELPFMTGLAETSSQAFYEYIQQNALDEFKDVSLLTANTHGPGLFHSHKEINKMADLKGMKIRGGSRMLNLMLEQMGAIPIGMPANQISESLSKGVIDACTLPYEGIPAFKIEQLVKSHTGFTGNRGMYTQTFAFVMNKNSYEKLPSELKKVIDDNSGINLAKTFGSAFDKSDLSGLKIIQNTKNKIINLDETETKLWQKTTLKTRESWYKEVNTLKIDGPKLVETAENLVKKYVS